MNHAIDERRLFALNEETIGEGEVWYWMSRDMRVRDNWALVHAQDRAIKRGVPLRVVFCLTPSFPDATLRAYDFLLRGLEEVENDLRALGVGFSLFIGDPAEQMCSNIGAENVSEVVVDFSPLRLGRAWRTTVASSISVRMVEVDAHNIVPCRIASTKKEYAARTIRSKITKALPEWLLDIPRVRKHPHALLLSPVDWAAARASIDVDESVLPVDWCIPGERAAQQALDVFLQQRLRSYDDARNNPTVQGQSDLSPYLHFGHLSAQRVALAVQTARAPASAKASFLEELIVRRELSDNFCFYEPHYDDVRCFPEWAAKTLERHASDERLFRYSLSQFERAETHDELWNAAQREMVWRGKMHGYMRMYWAKKILEWSASPRAAMDIAIALNDRYELDGRDPNGYAGIAWSIGGVHDRPWFDRPIFGTVRYMSEGGCRSKFDVDRYVRENSGQ